MCPPACIHIPGAWERDRRCAAVHPGTLRKSKKLSYVSPSYSHSPHVVPSFPKQHFRGAVGLLEVPCSLPCVNDYALVYFRNSSCSQGKNGIFHLIIHSAVVQPSPIFSCQVPGLGRSRDLCTRARHSVTVSGFPCQRGLPAQPPSLSPLFSSVRFFCHRYSHKGQLCATCWLAFQA